VPEFRAPTGTHDFLPPESARWTALVAEFATQAARAGFGLVISPMFEDVGVFERVGGSTDIVRKEMYTLTTAGGDHLALRPEGTASIVRAFAEHRPTTPWKVWYLTPCFRYEKPQAGRYRQHHQLGAEVLGTDDPDADVEVIALLWGFYRSLGLTQLRLQLNSLGDTACRPTYLDALRAYMAEHATHLSAQSRETLTLNPLRVLDSKRPQDQAVIDAAPRIADHLCDACAAHFARVQAGLDRLAIPYELRPRLVRGLDYYTRTAFEIAADALASAQNAVGGGGRYDGLVEQMGGPPTSGIGFGAGIERILLTCDAEGVFAAPLGGVDVFIVDTTGGEEALVLSHQLRDARIGADRAYDARSMKAQMKAADRSAARIALIIGDDERAAGTVTVRDLRGDSHDQQALPRDQIVDHVRKLLGS
jgi:histidyl-tRNA synthetase